MSNNDKEIKMTVSQFLTEHGLNVDEIPTAPHKTPDLEASDSHSVYIVEIKEKTIDSKYEESKRESFEHGDIHEYQRDTTYANTIDGIISSSAKQLSTYTSPSQEKDRFNILWFSCRGNDRKLFTNQFIATFYGQVGIVEFSETPTTYSAYFFDNSSAFKCRDTLDLAILDKGDALLFLINSYSANIARFKKCGLAQSLTGFLFDPREKTIQDKVIFVGGNHNRSSEYNSIRYIQETYGLTKISAIRMKEFSASMVINRDDLSENNEYFPPDTHGHPP